MTDECELATPRIGDGTLERARSSMLEQSAVVLKVPTPRPPRLALFKGGPDWDARRHVTAVWGLANQARRHVSICAR